MILSWYVWKEIIQIRIVEVRLPSKTVFTYWQGQLFMLGQVSKFNRYSFPFYCRDTKDYLPPEITLTLAGGPLGVVLSMSNCSTSQRQRSRGWLLVSFSLVWVLLALLYWRWWFVLGGIQFPCWIQGMNALVASRGFIWQHEAGPYQHINMESWEPTIIIIDKQLKSI